MLPKDSQPMTNLRFTRPGWMLSLLAVVAFSALAATVGQSQSATPAGKPAEAGKASGSGRVVLYAAVGPELTQYDVDVDAATLVKRTSITLPANVQEAAWHPSKRYMYIAWSNGGPSNIPAGAVAPSGSHHGLSAFRVDPSTGALLPHGMPASLPSRPIHVTMDIPGTHALVAYNDPSGVTVHRIAPDGTIGAQIKQAPLNVGIYGHQVRVDPAGHTVFLMTRGNGPTASKPE